MPESRLYSFYRDEWGRTAREAFEAGLSTPFPASYAYIDTILVCGMGGSGAAGDYVAAVAARYGYTPVYVVKSADVPVWASQRTLVFAVSFSGNTLETLNCARKAWEHGAKLVAVTRGGRLGEWAEARGVPVVGIPYAPAPRAGWPGLFYSMMGVLVSTGLIAVPRAHIEESIRLLAETATAEREAEKVAEWLEPASKGLIAIVAPEPYYPAAIRFRSELAENAKLASDASQLPELGHNIIVGWARRGDVHIAVLDPLEEPWTALLASVIGIAKPASSYKLELQGSNYISKLVWATWIAGLASTLYADKHGLNPEEITEIREFRRKVGEASGWGA